MEELVAELGAAFMRADLDLTPQPRPDHAHYRVHWLEILKADKRAIFTAASKASEAASFLGGFMQPLAEPLSANSPAIVRNAAFV